MRKKEELVEGASTCMGHAHPEEMVSVLLSRDAAAPVAIRAWVAERLRLGKNVDTDEQIVTALACAQTMESEGRLWAGPFPGKTLAEAESLYKDAMTNAEADELW